MKPNGTKVGWGWGCKNKKYRSGEILLLSRQLFHAHLLFTRLLLEVMLPVTASAQVRQACAVGRLLLPDEPDKENVKTFLLVFYFIFISSFTIPAKESS